MKKNYVCPWCHKEFTAEVRYKPRFFNPATRESNSNEGKASASSTIVKCPECLNLIPTWKKEDTGNVIGRKHIHLRS